MVTALFELNPHPLTLHSTAPAVGFYIEKTATPNTPQYKFKTDDSVAAGCQVYNTANMGAITVKVFKTGTPNDFEVGSLKHESARNTWAHKIPLPAIYNTLKKAGTEDYYCTIETGSQQIKQTTPAIKVTFVGM